MFELHRVSLRVVFAMMCKVMLDRETLIYAYPYRRPYSTPPIIGPRGTSWCVATSGVAVLECSSSVSIDTLKHIARRGMYINIVLNLVSGYSCRLT